MKHTIKTSRKTGWNCLPNIFSWSVLKSLNIGGEAGINLSCFNLFLKVQGLSLDLASEKRSSSTSTVLHPIHIRHRCTENLELHDLKKHSYLLTEFIKIQKGSIVERGIIKHICQHPQEWVGWLLGRSMPAVLQAEASAEETADRHSEEQQIILIFGVVPLSLQDKKPDHNGAMLRFLHSWTAISTQNLTFRVTSSRKQLQQTAAGTSIWNKQH